MMRPIQFQKDQKINLNLLKRQLDRRVDLITMMVKGIKPNNNQKICAGKCCQENKCTQTQQASYPLIQLPNLSLSNTPSMKSLKSPTALKRSGSTKNKQNQVNQSATSIQNKSKKALKAIQQSQQEALKTSRYLKKLQSEKKKQIKQPTVNQSTSKKSQKFSVVGSNFGRKITNFQSQSKEDNVINSFQLSKKKVLTQRKSFGNIPKRVQKQPTTEQKFNFSFSSSIVDKSQSKSRVKSRRDSFNVNESFMGSSNNVTKRQSYSTNMNTTGYDENQLQNSKGPKRMIIAYDIKQKIQQQFQRRLQGLKKKSIKQPKTNNIRVSLLKRLDDKHHKSLIINK